MIRRMLASMVSAAVLAGLVLAAPAALAGTQSTTCTSTNKVTLTPGLTFSSSDQTLKGRGHLSGCTGGGVTSASVTGKGKGSGSCVSFKGVLKITITWNTAETSVAKLRVSVDMAGARGGGKVVSGKFAGESITATDVSATPLEGDCSSSTPLTKLELDATLAL